MKFILSYAAQEQKIQTLQERVQELEEELFEAKRGNNSHQKNVRRDSLMSQDTEQARLTPSYARPTISSRIKTSRQTNLSTAKLPQINHTVLQYKDSRLVDDHMSDSSLLKHTRSSADRTKDPGAASCYGVLYTTSHVWDVTMPARRERAPRDIDVECADCIAMQAAENDTSDTSLEARSRLLDTSFYDNESRCNIPFGEAYQLLSEALNVAKQVVYYAVERHWPEQCLNYWPESWHQVRFGREELKCQGFGTEELPGHMAGVCGESRESILFHMHQVVNVRNWICHPAHGLTSKAIDHFLHRIQALAVALQDEARAFKLREMRDKLQQKLQDALAEIEAYEGLATLPGASPWPIHHQMLLSHTAHEKPSEFHPVHPAVKRAAEAWRTKYILVGVDTLDEVDHDRNDDGIFQGGNSKRMAKMEKRSKQQKAKRTVSATVKILTALMRRRR